MDAPQPEPRKLPFLPLLLAAIGVPYAAFSGGLDKLLANKPTAEQTADPLSIDGMLAGGADYSLPLGANPSLPPLQTTLPQVAGAPAPRLEGPLVQDLGEVIRFDIAPHWISQHWSRVSTVTAERELEGLRVPLVTGSRPDDLAGSLTYYFDKQHTVQRLTFRGTTGDERRLVTLVCTRFHFKEQPSLGGGMYVTMWNGKPTSVLRISFAPVVTATAPHSQKEILLEINRPGEYYGLSAETRQLLEHDAHVRRW